MENNRLGRIGSIGNAAVGIAERSVAAAAVVVVAVDQVASSRMEEGDRWMQQRRIDAHWIVGILSLSHHIHGLIGGPWLIGYGHGRLTWGTIQTWITRGWIIYILLLIGHHAWIDRGLLLLLLLHHTEERRPV
jgi:hypothetical protein